MGRAARGGKVEEWAAAVPIPEKKPKTAPAEPNVAQAVEKLSPLLSEFAKLDEVLDRRPDESTILPFRHLLEKNHLAPDVLRVVNELLSYKGLLLKTGTAVDGTLINVPSSAKNDSCERDPEMHQTKRGNQ